MKLGDTFRRYQTAASPEDLTVFCRAVTSPGACHTSTVQPFNPSTPPRRKLKPSIRPSSYYWSITAFHYLRLLITSSLIAFIHCCYIVTKLMNSPFQLYKINLGAETLDTSRSLRFYSFCLKTKMIIPKYLHLLQIMKKRHQYFTGKKKTKPVSASL